MFHPGGGTGRHAGLKILFAVMRVTVQFRSRVLSKPLLYKVGVFFILAFRMLRIKTIIEDVLKPLDVNFQNKKSLSINLKGLVYF